VETSRGSDPVGDAVDDRLAALATALEDADDLDADARLALLTDVEAAVAAALGGLDGL
jgi:hypothetical protein